MPSKQEFLADLPIFEFLTEDELEDLARISQEYEFEKDTVIAYQRDVADGLFIVRGGRLFASRVDEQGCVRDSRSFLTGDYFGEEWLFTPQTHPRTVQAKRPGRLFFIGSGDFIRFLQRHPDAVAALRPEFGAEGEHVAGLSPEAWEEAQKTPIALPRRSKARGISPEEPVEYATRRSVWLLVLRLTLPVLFLIGGLIAYLVFLPSLNGLLLRFIAPGFILFVLLFVIVYQTIDWYNDFFVITNRHIMHSEFNLSLSNFGTTVNTIPIDQVQSVRTVKPNIFSTLFNVGTAQITTAAQSEVLLFDFIDDPIAVRDTINRIRARVQALDAAREQEAMRQTLESHFAVEEPYRPVTAEETEAPAQETLRKPFGTRVREFLSSRVEVEEDGTITYRKHIIVLVYVVRWPVLVYALLALLALTMLQVMALPWTTVVPVIGLLGFLNLLWFVWQVEDWRNETFQVTDRYVIDIDRVPFGFGETRRQAQLSNVQNVSADRPGLLPTILNFGFVYIETAGATADITFENVADPNRVQQDIFIRRERFVREQRLRQGARRREEYAVLLDVYKQALEQDRIPQRTPPPELGQDGENEPEFEEPEF